MKKIYINISEVASYIGQNKWSIIEPFNRLWKKVDESYINVIKNDINVQKENIQNKKSILENNILKKEIEQEIKQEIIEMEKKVVKSNEIILDKKELIENELSVFDTNIKKTINDINIDTIDKRKNVKNSIKLLEKQEKINKKDSIRLLKETESLINKIHGTLNEKSAIEIYQEKYKTTLNTSQKYYSYFIKSSNNIEWYIGGRLDGLHDDYIIEVKNRTKGFFYNIKDYELTQIQLYLLLTGHTKAKLVEKFKQNIKVTDIDVDYNYIQKILSYLNIFINSMELFIENSDLKNTFVNLESDYEKELFLYDLYLIKINESNEKYNSDLDTN